MNKFSLTVCALFGLLLSSAVAQDETKEEAWRTEGVQRLEFTRYVPSGKKITLDFAYALNADCSPSDGGPAEVRTTTEPEHGTVEFTSGSRFPNFAKTNVRFKCNEKRTNGTLINYKSKSGYTGPDKFEVIILYPTGYAREVVYNVNSVEQSNHVRDAACVVLILQTASNWQSSPRLRFWRPCGLEA